MERDHPDSSQARATPRTAVRLVLALTLLLSACSAARSAAPDRDAEARGGKAGPRSADGNDGVPSGRCHGVDRSDVRGPRPSYLPDLPLLDYTADGAVCEAWWLRGLDDGFVPQGIALEGDTAWVSGYHYARSGVRSCQLVLVDLEAGDSRVVMDGIRYPRPTELQECRHGGALELDDHGLWLAGNQTIWLIDPDRLDHGDAAVIRTWRMKRPIRGSVMLLHDGRLGVGSYRSTTHGRLWWYDVDALLDGDAEWLETGGDVQVIPRRAQGVTWQGGLWVSSSGTSCGTLRPPTGAALASVPGAEEIELRGRDIWMVSESSADVYLDDDEAPTPPLLRLDRRQLLGAAHTDCDW